MQGDTLDIVGFPEVKFFARIFRALSASTLHRLSIQGFEQSFLSVSQLFTITL